MHSELAGFKRTDLSGFTAHELKVLFSDIRIEAVKRIAKLAPADKPICVGITTLDGKATCVGCAPGPSKDIVTRFRLDDGETVSFHDVITPSLIGILKAMEDANGLDSIP
jgi:hypothetical protein